MGITANTYRNWLKNGSGEDRRTTADKTNPSNKLSEKECSEVLEILYSEEFGDKSPHKVVPLLADRGKYICSESTMYRVLDEEKANKRRTQKRKDDTVRLKPNLVAQRPGQVINWDITYLPSSVKGVFYKALVLIDMFSRKIVNFRIFHQDTLENTRNHIRSVFVDNGLTIPEWIHGDNGSTLKGQTLASMLRSLGVIQSHSRPNVSNDNAYIESFFGTLKTDFRYPSGGFRTIEDSEKWMESFIRWYNDEPHSGINYVSPNQRHEGLDKEILEKRKKVFEKAREKYPERFGKRIRKIEYQGVVTLIPMKEEEITEYLENEKIRKVR